VVAAVLSCWVSKKTGTIDRLIYMSATLTKHQDREARPSAVANEGAKQAPGRRCRFCDAPLSHVFVDLGASPLCESYLSAHELDQMEPFFPLTVYVCDSCLLVQLPTFVSGEEIFSEYAYFSSFSTSYLEHARKHAHSLIERFGITGDSFVVEVASND